MGVIIPIQIVLLKEQHSENQENTCISTQTK